MPWVYLYTMATVYFKWSDKQFWNCSLKKLIAMIDEWQRIERNQAKQVGFMAACYVGGQDPDDLQNESDPKKLRELELRMGEALW